MEGDTITPAQNADPAATDTAPVSLYDKTEAIVTRQEAANAKAEELLKRQETLFANQRLAGTTGGNVATTPAKEESPKEYRARINKELAEGKYDRKN